MIRKWKWLESCIRTSHGYKNAERPVSYGARTLQQYHDNTVTTPWKPLKFDLFHGHIWLIGPSVDSEQRPWEPEAREMLPFWQACPKFTSTVWLHVFSVWECVCAWCPAVEFVCSGKIPQSQPVFISRIEKDDRRSGKLVRTE